MRLENVTMLFCDNEESQHYFYVPDDLLEDMNTSEFQCPICGCEISSEAGRVILVASSGKDTLKLIDEYGEE